MRVTFKYKRNLYAPVSTVTARQSTYMDGGGFSLYLYHYCPIIYNIYIYSISISHDNMVENFITIL